MEVGGCDADHHHQQPDDVDVVGDATSVRTEQVHQQRRYDEKDNVTHLLKQKNDVTRDAFHYVNNSN